MAHTKLIQDAYGEHYFDIKHLIDEVGFISRDTLCKIFDEDPEVVFPNDFWILALDDWDYSCIFGVDRFRPRIIRTGK